MLALSLKALKMKVWLGDYTPNTLEPEEDKWIWVFGTE
jgi:hypothetical protein